MSKKSSLGLNSFGAFIFNEPSEFNEQFQNPNSGSLTRSQYGFDQGTRRQYDRGDFYALTPVAEPIGVTPEIKITSLSGALIGNIRTDNQNTPIQSIEFAVDDKGCSHFKLVLNRLPEFEIEPASKIVIKILGTDFNWYSGIVNYPEDQGTRNNTYKFEGFGMRSFLNVPLDEDLVYESGTDIGEIVQDIVQNYIVSRFPIGYNVSKIDITTGSILEATAQLGKFPIDQVFDMLAMHSGFRWGVDAESEFFFEERLSTPIKTFHVGYGMKEFRPRLNIQNVVNAITLKRQSTNGSGESGWSLVGLFNDAASAHKYGTRRKEFQLPGHFSDDDGSRIGNGLLNELKEPKKSATVRGIPVVNGDSYLRNGIHRFINPLEDYNISVDEIEDHTEWSLISQTGDDIQKSDDSVIFMQGSSSLKLDYTSSDGAYVTKDISIKASIKQIKFYARSDKSDVVLRVGVGFTNWDERTVDMRIPQSSLFIPMIWDVSGFNLTEVRKFGIQINDTSGIATEIWIDKLHALITAHRNYNLEFKEAKYIFTGKRQAIDCEFGTLPPRLENYIASINKLTGDMRATQEIR